MSITSKFNLAEIRHAPLDSIQHLGRVNERELPPIEPANGNEPYWIDDLDFSNLTEKINKLAFFKERDEAMGYEDVDLQDWQERAHRLGITEGDETAWSELKNAELIEF